MEREKSSAIGRKARGMAIISKGETIDKADKDAFIVPSQSRKGVKYYVRVHNNIWACTCPDHQKNMVNCKHIWAIRFWKQLRKRAKRYKPIVIREMPILACVYCQSEKIKKHSIRKTQSGDRTRYKCLKCKKTFVEKPFKRMKGNGKIITLVLDLYFKGLSLRKIKHHLEQFYNFKVHHYTIYRWIRRYSQLVSNYVDKMQANTSEVWHTDEMMVKVNGQYVWLWNTMDSKTRFLLGNNLSVGREISDAENVLIDAKTKSLMKPVVMITDGLQSYREAMINQMKGTEHVRLPNIRDKTNNNAIERLHNTIRERDKVMRGFKTMPTAVDLLKGQRVYYNYVRFHSGIGMTPAERAGIKLNLGENRWLELIRQASRH